MSIPVTASPVRVLSPQHGMKFFDAPVFGNPFLQSCIELAYADYRTVDARLSLLPRRTVLVVEVRHVSPFARSVWTRVQFLVCRLAYIAEDPMCAGLAGLDLGGQTCYGRLQRNGVRAPQPSPSRDTQ